MALQVSDLIKEIRYKVGDIKATKWADERIISLLNEALDDLSRKVDVKKQEITLPIAPFQRKLIIPDPDFLRLLRIRQNGLSLKIIPFTKMDLNQGWDNKVGSKLEAIIYDHQNIGELTLYPMLNEVVEGNYESVNDKDGILLDIPGAERDNLDGIITELDTDDLVEKNIIKNGEAISSIVNSYYQINIIYAKKLPLVSSIDEIIDINFSFRSILAYYIAGLLLLDDTRQEVIQKGLLFIDKYKAEIQDALDRTKDDYQKVATHFVNYRTGFGDEYGN